MKNFKVTKRPLICLLVFSLILGLLFPGLGTMEAQAAGKPKLSKKKLTMYVGNTATLKVKHAGGKVTWSSSRKKVASVNKKGKIKAKKAGTTVITAKVRKKKLTCKVTVKPKKPTLNKKSAVLNPGATLQLKLRNAKGKVRWKSSNKAVAAVSKKGKVTAKSKGKATITAVWNKKKYTCKVQVQPKETPAATTPTVPKAPTAPTVPQHTRLSISYDQSSFTTRESSVRISGRISHDANLTAVSYRLCDSEGQIIGQGPVAPGDTWTIALYPAVGTNTVTLTVTDVTGHSVSASLIFVRYSANLELDSQTVSGDELESRDFSEHMADFEREEATDGGSASDTIKILMEKNSTLAQKLENGTLEAGDTYMLPASDDFPSGFTGVLESWGSPSDASADPNTYLEVTFREPQLDDIFDGDGCIDFGGGVNVNDPIGFLMVPDGSQISAKSARGTDTYRADSYEHSVFPEGMADIFQPNVTAKADKSVSIILDLADVLLYDGDRDKSTKDQIRLTGSIELADIKFDGRLEWKEKSLALMPQQVKMDVSYTTKVNVGIKTSGTLDFKDLVKKANGEFENKIEKCGVELSGIDMSDRLMLGVIGLNFAAFPTASVADIAQITAASLTPKFFVALYLDLNGKVSAEVSLAYNYESYRECGFNVCKKDAQVTDGVNAAVYSETKTLAGDYLMGTYDRERKSKTEYGNPEPKVTLDGNVEAEARIGCGAMFGILMWGLMPGDFYGGCEANAEFTLDGKAEIIKTTTNHTLGNTDLEICADIKTGFVLGTDLKFSVKIVQGFMEDWGLNLEFSKTKDFPVFEVKLNVPTFQLEGTVYDLTDKTVTEHPILPNAEIYIYEKKKIEQDIETVTAEDLLAVPADVQGKSDENGNYKIAELGKRDYLLVAKVPGYQYYMKKDLSFSNSDIRQDIYIEPIREKNWLNVCKPYSYTQSYGEYLGDGNGTMLISGVEYDAGFYLNNGNQGTGGTSDALWNLEGKYSSLNVRIGHLDDTKKLNAMLYIYLDGSDEPNQIIELNCQDVSRVYTIDLNYAQSAKFSLKKTQWSNWATSSFGFVEGVWNGKNGAEGTVNFQDPFADVDWSGNFMEICRPYTGISCTTYLGDTEDTFTMSGKSYDTGFVLTTQSITDVWGNSAAMFNTNGNFSALKVKIGHVDANYTEDAKIYIYLDGESEPSQTYTINASDVARIYTIPLNYANSVKIALQNVHSNWTTESFGFAEGEWIK